MEYTKKSRADGGLGDLDISLIADTKREISNAYGVLSDAGIAYRGTFIVDDKHNVRHMSINDLPVGRNVDEYLRLVKVNISFYFRPSNILTNTEKSAQPLGSQDKEP